MLEYGHECYSIIIKKMDFILRGPKGNAKSKDFLSSFRNLCGSTVFYNLIFNFMTPSFTSLA